MLSWHMLCCSQNVIFLKYKVYRPMIITRALTKFEFSHFIFSWGGIIGQNQVKLSLKSEWLWRKIVKKVCFFVGTLKINKHSHSSNQEKKKIWKNTCTVVNPQKKSHKVRICARTSFWQINILNITLKRAIT